MSEKKGILLVDDEPVERRLLYHALKNRYAVREAEDQRSALATLDDGGVDLVILDLHLPPNPETAEEGIRIQRAIHRKDPLLPVIITTGDQDHDLALEMVRRGVADFLLKPVDPAVLEIVIERALERARLHHEIRDLQRQVRERYSFGSLIGRSPAMVEVFSKLERLAAVKTTVLLLGESGTGKSALARALHLAGPRAERPFVVVDGAAIPESLMESELFGHVRGAFTGADEARTGKITAAEGGTLFLDEIGNLSAAAQAKLLLFLDDQTCSPVGSSEARPVDVRLIAATNLDLDALVQEGRFRADLLYRLHVAAVVLPPLRERTEDVPALAEHLLSALCKETGRPPCRLTPAAVELLASYPWPGNVRQLKHVLESSLVLARGDTLDAADLTPPALPTTAGDAGDAATAGSFKERLVAYERKMVEEALARSGGNKAAAGRALGLDENQIRYLCRKHGLG